MRPGFWVAATPFLATIIVGLVGLLYHPSSHKKTNTEILDRLVMLEVEFTRLSKEIEALRELYNSLYRELLKSDTDDTDDVDGTSEKG